MNTSQQNYTNDQASNAYMSKPRKKTGPSPKYGPDQAKKMVSMRLSPDALSSIKTAAEKVFRDSQADVIEKVMRFMPVELLEELNNIAKNAGQDPQDVLKESLTLYKQKHGAKATA